MEQLEAAIKSGDVKAVESALGANPELARGMTSMGVSPLLFSAYYRQKAVAEAIRPHVESLDIFEAAALGDLHALEGFSTDAHREFNTDGFTALGLAAYFGHLESLKLLLVKGADPNVLSNNGLNVAPLHSALSGGHKEMARILVEAGADVNLAGGEGYTPLHYTASAGDIETTRFLLERGARADVKLKDGRTPAELAAEGGFTDLAAILG